MKILATIFSLLFSFSPLPLTSTSEEIYARITNSETYFYSSPNDEAKFFLLPNSYFVLLLEDAGENYYRAQYMDVLGYVKKEEVTPIVGTPQNPYADKSSFRVFSLNGLNLRSSPDSSSPFNIVTAVPYLERNLIFYGQIEGETAIEDKSSTWYYCKYLSGTQSYSGYLYSVFCDLLTPITINNEVFEAREEPPFLDQTSTTEDPPEGFSLTTPVQIIIAVAVSLPCIILIYLLFKPTKIVTEENSKDKKAKKKKIKRLKKADYYEIED